MLAAASSTSTFYNSHNSNQPQQPQFFSSTAAAGQANPAMMYHHPPYDPLASFNANNNGSSNQQQHFLLHHQQQQQQQQQQQHLQLLQQQHQQSSSSMNTASSASAAPAQSQSPSAVPRDVSSANPSGAAATTTSSSGSSDSSLNSMQMLASSLPSSFAPSMSAASSNANLTASPSSSSSPINTASTSANTASSHSNNIISNSNNSLIIQSNRSNINNNSNSNSNSKINNSSNGGGSSNGSGSGPSSTPASSAPNVGGMVGSAPGLSSININNISNGTNTSSNGGGSGSGTSTPIPIAGGVGGAGGIGSNSLPIGQMLNHPNGGGGGGAGGNISNIPQQMHFPDRHMHEEITTIFVVGFPEDMAEREFQNMFIFCHGFEAATLKTPNHGDDENIPQYKKQIIGFVKFRTRFEALHARDMLNGRKVDAERGCVLKAEIAKKNLHARRGLNCYDFTSHGPSAFSPVGGPNFNSHRVMLPQRSHSMSSKDLAFNDHYFMSSPFPKDIVGLSGNGSYPLNNGNNGGAGHFDYFSPPAQTHQQIDLSYNPSRRGSPTSSIDATTAVSDGINSSSSGSSSSSDLAEFKSSATVLNSQQAPPGVAIAGSLLGGGSAASGKAMLDSPRFNSAPFSDSLLEPPPPSVTSLGGVPTRSASERGFSSALYNSESLLSSSVRASSVMSPPSLSINTSLVGGVGQSLSGLGPITDTTAVQSPTTGMMLPGSLVAPTGLPSPSTPFSNITSYRSLADYNPPCNTLYVGNLPNNTNEDELRALFSRCPGFKRLSYKQRPGGPMCFVEFEEVSYANQALLELHGNPLSNQKGGLRLSFSRNPLGVRQANMMMPPNLTSDSSRLIFGC